MQTRYTSLRTCPACGEAPVTHHGLCQRCDAEFSYLASLDEPIQNFEYCRDCGKELSRSGWCYEDGCKGWRAA